MKREFLDNFFFKQSKTGLEAYAVHDFEATLSRVKLKGDSVLPRFRGLT